MRGRLNDLAMKVLVVTASSGGAACCEGRSFGIYVSLVKGIPLSHAPPLGICDRASVPLLFSHLSSTLKCFSMQHRQGTANWSSVSSTLVAIVDNCRKGLEIFGRAACLPCFGAEPEDFGSCCQMSTLPIVHYSDLRIYLVKDVA